MMDVVFCILLLLGGAFVREIFSGGGFIIRGTKNYDKRLKQIDDNVRQKLKESSNTKQDIQEFADKYYKKR